MDTPHQLKAVLNAWTTILGSRTHVGTEDSGRELWPIIAEDGTHYFLKRLSPWRNLPVADEARVLRWLSKQHIDVAEFMITEDAALTAEQLEHTYILIPRLTTQSLSPAEVLNLEAAVGQAIAELHRALAAYPWPANSYRERLTDALLGDLRLPPDIAQSFIRRRDRMAEAIGRLPMQLIHGDLTPENVLLRSPNELAGFIDFDHLPLAPRIWDISKYLSRRMRLRWRRGAEPTDRLAHLAPLIRGYHKVSPLTDQELDALPAALAAGNIIEASYGQRIASGELQRRKLPDYDEILVDTIDAARWHLANYTAVEEAVSSATI